MSFLQGFDDWMEVKQPGWKADKARERDERECSRLERCKALLAEYGNEDAVFAETKGERLLRVSLDHLADRSKFANSDETYISGFDGWTCGRLPVRVWNAVSEAFPFPSNVAGVWSEYLGWERLIDARIAFCPDYASEIWVRARQEALEHLLDTMPSRDDDDFAARLGWFQWLTDRGFSRDVQKEAALSGRMIADHQFLRTAR